MAKSQPYHSPNIRPVDWLKGQLRADNNSYWEVAIGERQLEIKTTAPEGQLALLVRVHGKLHGALIGAKTPCSATFNYCGKAYELNADEAHSIVQHIKEIHDRNLPVIKDRLSKACSEVDVRTLGAVASWRSAHTPNGSQVLWAQIDGITYTLSEKQLFVSAMAGSQRYQLEYKGKDIPKAYEDAKVLAGI